MRFGACGVDHKRPDLKLKYYDMMIQHALHGDSYLDVAKYYYKVWETPSIKEDVNDKGRAVCALLQR